MGQADAAAPFEKLSIAGVGLEILRRGAGRPLVVLHGLAPLDPESPVLDLLERLPYEKVALMGLSFGGWLAAEIATICPHRLARLILVDAVGIKVSDRETPDILDVFNTAPAMVERRRWHDTEKWGMDPDAMSDEALVAHARNRDALSLYAWHPYMHNPQLKRWLPRIAVPTLVLWGGSDGIVTPAYGRAYSALIPGARFEVIEAAGHHPEIEQAAAFAARVVAFLEAP